MKIRTDFVTNSSSSSFCSVHAESSKLGEILNKYKDLFSDDCNSEIKLTENGFDFNGEDILSDCIRELEGKKDIVNYIIEILRYAKMGDFYYDSNEELDNLSDELKKNEKEILKTIKFNYDYDYSYSDFDMDSIHALARYIGLKEDEYDEDDEDDWDEILTRATEKSEEEGLDYLWINDKYSCYFDGESGKRFKSNFSSKVAGSEDDEEHGKVMTESYIEGCTLNLENNPDIREILKKYEDLFEIESLKKYKIKIINTANEYKTELEKFGIDTSKIPDKELSNHVFAIHCMKDLNFNSEEIETTRNAEDYLKSELCYIFIKLSEKCNEQEQARFKCLIDEIKAI